MVLLVRLESTLAEQLEERTREKYQLLDQMSQLTGAADRSADLGTRREVRESETRVRTAGSETNHLTQGIYPCEPSWNFSQKYRKLLSRFCYVERTEVEKLVETRLKEDGREKVLEKRVSKLIDDPSVVSLYGRTGTGRPKVRDTGDELVF